MTIQKKMFLYIIIFLILPFLILGFLYYGILLDSTKENLDRSSYEILEQMERNILIKTNRLKNKTDVLVSDREFQKILRETNFLSRNIDTYDAVEALDGIMEQYFYDEDDLENIIISMNDGGIYTYRGMVDEQSMVSFIMKYGRAAKKPGELSWFGISGGNDELLALPTIASGLSIADNNYKKDRYNLATIYFIYSPEFFDSVNTYSMEEGETFMICTHEGNQVYISGNSNLRQLWEISVEANWHIYRNTRGSMEVLVKGEKCILNFYTSPTHGWKYIRIVRYSEYFSEAEHIKSVTILTAIFLFIILCVVNILWLKRLMRPVQTIVAAMNEVGKRNFDIELSVNSRDEFGAIANGFNTMVGEIKALFGQVVEEEQKSKEAELEALQYQINPHFLYNTLSAIRLTAIFNKQDEIARMLSLLGKFLHNTLSNINKQILLEDEFENIKNYVDLYQIRYNNQIEVDFSLEEGIERCYIYGMLIQPVVENAIMHGLSERLASSEPAILCIRAERDNTNLIIKVRDNGVGMTKEQCMDVIKEKDYEKTGLHIGLSNINRRIYYLYGDNYGLTIKSQPECYTEVMLILPANRI